MAQLKMEKYYYVLLLKHTNNDEIMEIAYFITSDGRTFYPARQLVFDLSIMDNLFRVVSILSLFHGGTGQPLIHSLIWKNAGQAHTYV